MTSAFLNQIRSRRRKSSIGLTLVAVAFAALTWLSVAIVLGQGDLHFRHAITFASMNVLIWTGWIVAFVKHLSENHAPVTAGVPVREALQRAISQRQLHLLHLRIIAIGLLLSTPLVALSIYQMLETGRLSRKICLFESCLRSACMELPSLASGATTSGTPAWKSRTLNRYFAITMDLKNQIRTTRPETWRETNGKESRN